MGKFYCCSSGIRYVNEITAAIGLRLKEAIDDKYQVKVQVGKPIGESRPPRIYYTSVEVPNAGRADVVTHMHEAAGTNEAYEYPQTYEITDEAAEKTADILQEYLNGFPEDEDIDIIFEGNEEMITDLTDMLDIPENVDTIINKGEVSNSY